MSEDKKVLPKDKLYVVVRADISPGYQIVQSCHAVEHLAVANLWECYAHTKHLGDTMVVLQVPSQLDLDNLYLRLRHEYPTLPVSLFYEPDIMGHTAMAIAPGVLVGVDYCPMLAHLPLAGSHLTRKPIYERIKAWTFSRFSP